MKSLNFYPYYEPYLASHKKTTTFRLGDVQLRAGDGVPLTIGWNDKESRRLHDVVIERVYKKRICDLSAEDFDGESPDCKQPEPTALVLGAIYRQIIAIDHQITVVKFRHL